MVPGTGGTVTLLCREPKGWAARKEGTPTAVEHPGSAVQWEGTLWEVLSVDPGRDGVRYRLAAWDGRHVVRVRHLYDAGTEADRERESLRRADAVRLRQLILAAAPLSGLLPGPVQSRWEVELGVPAARLTILSTVIPFIAGTATFVLTMAAAFGACSLPSGLLPLIWFFPESILRFGLAMSQSIPVGSVPGLVFWYVWRGIARGSAKA